MDQFEPPGPEYHWVPRSAFGVPPYSTPRGFRSPPRSTTTLHTCPRYLCYQRFGRAVDPTKALGGAKGSCLTLVDSRFAYSVLSRSRVRVLRGYRQPEIQRSSPSGQPAHRQRKPAAVQRLPGSPAPAAGPFPRCRGHWFLLGNQSAQTDELLGFRSRSR